MSIAIDEEAFEVGMDEVIQRLKASVKAYENFLITYGTVPDMTIQMKLQKLVRSIDPKTGERKKLGKVV